ncbi:MAG: FAD-dependent thymidylate synthase [Deltaproteobacteria bacterium]|nr:FAD-dependent thymidylate synthase [Deltaproteobacteria bacterium]
MKWASQKPTVKLISIIQKPYDLAIASARTCYSSKGIISIEEISPDEQSRLLRDKIAKNTKEAGHLTTRQHAHFVFALENVSRSCIWSFLHSHPYYNSEQVSQRYVKVKEENFLIPQLPEISDKIYRNTLRLQMDAYLILIELVKPTVELEYYKIFPHRKKSREKWDKTILKKSYEVARYCLPIATYAYLYHTISALTLLRYHRMQAMLDTPCEQTELVSQMIDQVVKLDPDFKKDLSEPYNIEETPEARFFFSLNKASHPLREDGNFIQEFDLSLKNLSSKLIDYSAHAEKTLANAVRNIFGASISQLSDEKAIDLVLHPNQNKYFSDTLNPALHTKLSRALHHVHFTFRKKLSHTADSQEQRHRTLPSSRPILEAHYIGQPDFIIPQVIKKNEHSLEIYLDVMKKTYDAINQLLEQGVSFEKAHYLLPNSHAIRFEESGDLLSFHHKWKLRTCYNAQEEIFYSTIDELKQVSQLFPNIGNHILAPCYLRKEAHIKPYCPEGDRYCGIPVWKQPLAEYQRLI